MTAEEEYLGDVRNERRLSDMRQRIESLQEDNNVLESERDNLTAGLVKAEAEIERLKEMHALNDALPPSYDLTDPATVELAVELEGVKDELSTATDKLLDASVTVKDIAHALDIAKSRRAINLIRDQLVKLSEELRK